MKNIINREQPFQVLATNFSIGPSSSGYELEISADGVNYTSLFTVGANVTRMVTGVANGSYYRLAGNTDEGVVVNWRTQCNDGGEGSGSGSTGPQGPQGPQGGVGPQGPQGQDGIEQAPTVLKSVNELPSDAEEGDVVALYAEGEGLPYGIIFEERNDLGENEDMSGGRFQFPIDGFADVTQENPLQFGSMTAPDNTNYDMYVYQDEWGLSFVLSTDGDMYDPNFALTMSVGSDNAGYNMYSDMVVSYHYTESTDEYYVVDIFPETTGSVSFDIPQAETEIGVFQYDGNDWNAVGGGAGGSSPIVAIDNLNGTGSANTIYDYNGRLYHWVSGTGRWGKWVIANYESTSYSSPDNQMNYLNYSYIPSSTTFLCNIKLVSPRYSLSYDSANSALLVYDNAGGTGNVVATVYKNGQEVTVIHPSYTSRSVKIRWIEGLITLNCGAFVALQDNISTTESTGHYEAIDVDFFKGENKNGSSASGFYLPAWNSEGLVYGNAMNVTVAQRKINTTTYNNTMYFLAESSRAGTAWQSWYFPTQGGAQGQVLASNGDAEPVWETRIKAVKITSAAYEALQTKDPNTLYLIDDNV